MISLRMRTITRHDSVLPVLPNQFAKSLLQDVIPMEEVAATDSAEHAVTVGLGVTVRNLDICPAGVMTLDMWLKLTWTDYRLAWDPQQYDGLSSFRIPSSKASQ